MVRSRAEPGITSSRVEVPRVLVVFLCVPPHHQVNQQQQEAQQLNQDLVQQKAELMALRSSLENKEKVRLIRHLLSDRLLGFTHPDVAVLEGGVAGQQQPGSPAGGAGGAAPLRSGQRH